MSKFKRILRAVLFPSVWLVILISAPAFAALIYVFVQGMENTWLAYCSYAASAYATAVISARVPRIIHAFRTSFQDHPRIRRILESEVGMRYRSDLAYRAEISLYMGLAVNLLYTFIKMVSGIVFRSLWFGALAAYYLLLSILRFSLLNHVNHRSVGQNLLAEWKRYRLCGAILLVMNQALAVVVALVVYRSSGFEYPGYLIYIMAMYTFYAIINALRNVIKYRKKGSPALSASKAISMVAALVSMLSLETAMLSQFGSTEEVFFRRVMTGCTGGAVCTIVLAMAIYMIAHSTRRIKALQQGA